jgi:hypothetical protein
MNKMANIEQVISLPSRKTLQLIEKSTYPLGALVAVGLGGVILWQTMNIRYGIVWVAISGFLTLAIWRSPFELHRPVMGRRVRVDLGGTWGGVVPILFTMGVIVIASYTSEREVVLVTHFWPVAVFVTTLFARQYRGKPNNLKIYITGIIIAIGLVVIDSGVAAITEGDFILKYGEVWNDCINWHYDQNYTSLCPSSSVLWPGFWYMATAFLAFYHMYRHRLYRTLDAANRWALKMTSERGSKEVAVDLSSMIERSVDAIHTVFNKDVVSFISLKRANSESGFEYTPNDDHKLSPFAYLKLRVVAIEGTEKRAEEIKPWRATEAFMEKRTSGRSRRGADQRAANQGDAARKHAYRRT